MSDLHTAFQMQKSKLELDMLRAPTRWPPHVYQQALRELEEELKEAMQELKAKGIIVPHPPVRHSTLSPVIWRNFSLPPEELPAPPPPPLPSETTFGEIEAFRVWRVFDGKPRLFSSYTDHEWKPGETMVADKGVMDNDDDVTIFSAMGIRSGIHAWKSMVEVVEYGKSMLANKHHYLDLSTRCSVDAAFGRVKLWGDVVEHKRGYRAQFAKIIGIDDLVGEGDRRPEYNINNDRIGRRDVFVWLGEELAALQERYFPERKRKV